MNKTIIPASMTKQEAQQALIAIRLSGLAVNPDLIEALKERSTS